MIVKKMKNTRADKSKAAHIAHTLDYICAVMEHEPGDKCLWIGSHNMHAIDHQERKIEMIELAEKSVKSKNPMQHVLLSFRREDQITEEQIREATADFLRDMGYEGCQMVYAAHQNTDNFHVHMVINRIDPNTYTARSDSHDIEKMHKSIARMQQTYGWTGEEHDRYVMMDGEAIRTQYAGKQEIKMSDKARAYELHQGEKSIQRIAAEEIITILKDAKSWHEIHELLATKGFTYEKKGGGAILRAVKTNGEEVELKPSSLAKWASLKNMEKRLGTFTPSRQEPEPRQPEPMPSVPREVFDEFQKAKITVTREREAEYKRFEEERRQLTAERKEAFDIIKSAEIDWKSKELALAALHKVSKELYKDNFQSLVERYKEKVEKGKQIVIKATDFEIWARNNLQGRAEGILQGIETTPYRLYIPSVPVPEHTIQAKRELFLQYHEAVKADRYRITCVSKELGKNGKPKALILDMNKNDVTIGYTPEQILRCIGDINPNSFGRSYKGMSHFEGRDEHIYFTPLSDHKWHFFIDDLTPERLIEVKRDGLSPACVIETSPRNYSAIFTLPKLETRFEQDIINELASGLNIRYGDVGLCGAVHPHRVPGFWNVKDSYRTNCGYPIVSILESTGKECDILKTYMNYANGYFEYKHQTIEHNSRTKENIKDKSLDDKQSDIVCDNELYVKIYDTHRKAVSRIIGIEEANQDKSRLDGMIAIRLRGTGHSKEEIKDILYSYATRTGREKHDLDKYVELTANFAFSPEGTYRLEKMSQWISQWKHLENNITNQTLTIEEQEKGRQRQIEREIEKEKGRNAVIHTRSNEQGLER